MSKKIVTVIDGIDGRMRILYQDRRLKFRQLDIHTEQAEQKKKRSAYILIGSSVEKVKMGKNASYTDKK